MEAGGLRLEAVGNAIMPQAVKLFEPPLEGSQLKQEVLDGIIRRVVEVAQLDPTAGRRL